MRQHPSKVGGVDVKYHWVKMGSFLHLRAFASKLCSSSSRIFEEEKVILLPKFKSITPPLCHLKFPSIQGRAGEHWNNNALQCSNISNSPPLLSSNRHLRRPKCVEKSGRTCSWFHMPLEIAGNLYTCFVCGK